MVCYMKCFSEWLSESLIEVLGRRADGHQVVIGYNENID